MLADGVARRVRWLTGGAVPSCGIGWGADMEVAGRGLPSAQNSDASFMVRCRACFQSASEYVQDGKDTFGDAA